MASASWPAIPALPLVAFLTLALGIGANTAIFSMVEALLVKPLPYPDPSHLVVPATIFQRGNSDTGSVAYADILDWKAERELFEAVSAYVPNDLDVAGGDEPERIHAVAADEDYFRVMGSQLLLGRAPSRRGKPLRRAPRRRPHIRILDAAFRRRSGGRRIHHRIERRALPGGRRRRGRTRRGRPKRSSFARSPSINFRNRTASAATIISSAP